MDATLITHTKPQSNTLWVYFVICQLGKQRTMVHPVDGVIIETKRRCLSITITCGRPRRFGFNSVPLLSKRPNGSACNATRLTIPLTKRCTKLYYDLMTTRLIAALLQFRFAYLMTPPYNYWPRWNPEDVSNWIVGPRNDALPELSTYQWTAD